MRILIGCVALMFASTLRAQTGDREAIEKAVRSVNAQMTKAAETLDVDRLFSYVLDNNRGSIVQYGNVLLTRDDAMARVKANLRGIRKIEYRWNHEYVTVVSPTIALLVADGESVATTEDGQTFSNPFAQTVVFVLTDGQWKVLHAHQSGPVRR